MTSSIDIYRCAKLVYDQYDAEADLIAAVRVDRLLEFGEIEGHQTWRGILRAIVEIGSIVPKDGEAVH